MQPARIDETRGCWCDHNGVTYPIPDILCVEDPEHRMDGVWTVKVTIEPVVVMKSKVVWIETASPHHAWDICLALRQARTNLAVERSKGSLWGPAPSVKGETLMKTIGFFKTHTAEEALAWVKPMTEAEKVTCIRYLKAGTVKESYRGISSCRVCRTMLGSTDNLTPDGKWLYPGKWEHYIEEHDVRPPNEEFIRDALLWAASTDVEDPPVDEEDGEVLRGVK